MASRRTPEQARKYRAAYLANPENRLKQEVRMIFRDAVRYGKLLRQPCEVCGEAKTEGHHSDYSKPLDVRWLCRLHHIELHRGDPKTAAQLARKRTHCQRGHELTDQNCPRNKNGKRQCRICQSIMSKERYQAKRTTSRPTPN